MFALCVTWPNRPEIQVTQRVEVPCVGSVVLIIDGQSNAGNSGSGPRQTAAANVLNFAQNGRCYRAEDPLLGTDGDGTNFATQLGNMLAKPGGVVLVPMAVGGATIAKLAQGERLKTTLANLNNAGLRPTHILLVQGEADAAAGTTQAQYLDGLKSLLSEYRRNGVTAPLYVAQATRCDLIKPTNRDAIREAQGRSWRLFAEPGPDMDLIEGRNPIDGCHLSADGVTAAAAAWANILK